MLVVGGGPLRGILGDTLPVTVHGLPHETEAKVPGRPYTGSVDVEETLPRGCGFLSSTLPTVTVVTLLRGPTVVPFKSPVREERRI